MIPLSRAAGLPTLLIVAGCILAGCAETSDGPTAQEVAPATGAEAAAPPTTAETVEDFDTTTAEERAEAATPVGTATEQVLGTTVASLGDPADPGFWAETPLVQETRQGRLTYSATGQSVSVQLRPSGGAPGSGTRVSLPAMRVLGAPLTALPELTVIGL